MLTHCGYRSFLLCAVCVLVFNIGAAENQPPVAFAREVSVFVNSHVDFQLLGEDGDAGVEQALIFIVGDPRYGTISNFMSTTGALTYSPEEDYTGSDSFKFYVKEAESGLRSAIVKVNITVMPGIVANPALPQAGETVTFSPPHVDSSDSLTYAWNFGDGRTSNSPVPQHSYGSPGTYRVGLTVSDGTNQFQFSKLMTVSFERLTIGYLKINLNFAKPHRDRLELKGKVPGVVEGSKVRIDIGGIRKNFLMDAARNGVTESARVKFSENPNKTNEFIALFNDGDFLPLLADEGFSSSLTVRRLRLVPIYIHVDNKVYFRLQQVTYSSPPLPVEGQDPKRGVAVSGRDGQPSVFYQVTIKLDFRRPDREKLTFKAVLPREEDTPPSSSVWVDIGGLRFGEGGSNANINVSSDSKRWFLSMSLVGNVAPLVAELGFKQKSIPEVQMSVVAQVNGRIYYRGLRARYLYNPANKTGSFNGK